MLIPIILAGLSNEEDPAERHSIDSPSMLRLSIERPSILRNSIERLTRQTSNLSMEETLVATTTQFVDGTTNRVRPRSWWKLDDGEDLAVEKLQATPTTSKKSSLTVPRRPVKARRPKGHFFVQEPVRMRSLDEEQDAGSMVDDGKDFVNEKLPTSNPPSVKASRPEGHFYVQEPVRMRSLDE
eukprot:CAMPEP_0198230278 /NCGR_PEP_ID=MMETSP1445-20131203/114580_1 /TAXON_ID=36898 /ORGANISM="Pyramimonas sp., Strain CCMP2087" /LENGTH=182 /DNA_ID=CAMNT_0043910809 /DNA_START=858 /DNA_END=1406 /DNA_ORIENTATION=+